MHVTPTYLVQLRHTYSNSLPYIHHLTMSSTTFNTVNTETMSSKCELGQGADVHIDSLSRYYLVHNIASIFTQIARKNDRLDPKSITKPTSLSFPTGYKPLTAASLRLANKKASFFFSLRYQPEESLESLLDYVVKSCPSGTNAIFFGLLVYMSRLAKISRTGRGPFLVHSFNVNVLVLMALIAAAKYFSDRRYSMLAYQGVRLATGSHNCVVQILNISS